MVTGKLSDCKQSKIKNLCFYIYSIFRVPVWAAKSEWMKHKIQKKDGYFVTC